MARGVALLAKVLIDLVAGAQIVGRDQDAGHAWFLGSGCTVARRSGATGLMRHLTAGTATRRCKELILATTTTDDTATRAMSMSIRGQPVMSTMPPTSAGPMKPPPAQPTVYRPA